MQMSPPWIIFVREMEALFANDSDVRVEYNNDEKEVKLYVENVGKADALSKLIPTEKDFGNVILKIEVIPANTEENIASLFQKAFAGNTAVNSIEVVSTLFENTATYIVFKPEVVQFYDDNISDFNGVCSTLYQEIAKEIFTDCPAHFCTDLV